MRTESAVGRGGEILRVSIVSKANMMVMSEWVGRGGRFRKEAGLGDFIATALHMPSTFMQEGLSHIVFRGESGPNIIFTGAYAHDICVGLFFLSGAEGEVWPDVVRSMRAMAEQIHGEFSRQFRGLHEGMVTDLRERFEKEKEPPSGFPDEFRRFDARLGSMIGETAVAGPPL